MDLHRLLERGICGTGVRRQSPIFAILNRLNQAFVAHLLEVAVLEAEEIADLATEARPA